jgi:hypothetical protein
MSGVEIIGLLLGGLPFVISAAEDYRRGFEPFLKWHRYKREFRSFVNSVDLEKRMFDGLLRQLLEFSDIPLEEKQLLLTGTSPGKWSQEETATALKVRLGDSYLSCMYLLEKMEEDMLELQKILSLKDGSVSNLTSTEVAELIIDVLIGGLGKAWRRQVELSKKENLSQLQQKRSCNHCLNGKEQQEIS